MRIIINGFEESIPEKSTIADVILGNDEYDLHMIVELNHRFIHQKDYPSVFLVEGDILELIHPAFGG
jgi:thiamine biosynthesis protein ThiS